jgi:hypothetical protein
VAQAAVGEKLGIIFLNGVASAFERAFREANLAPDVRSGLLDQLVFDLATALDGQIAVVHKGRSYSPVLCYRDDDGDEEELVTWSGFDYHDYAHAAADAAREG